MKANPLPSYDTLLELFEVDFDIGLLRRRKDGKLLTAVGSRGYPYVIVGRKQYLAHRVIYFMFHGVEPEIVDHIDGDTLNNAITNLRAANALQSAANKAARGFCHRSGKRKPYQAVIQHAGKRQYLGWFATAEEARVAYLSAAKRLRGEFAADRLR